MGKYSSVTPKLPKLVTERSEEVEKLTQEFRQFTVTELIKKYAWWRLKKKELEAREKEINKTIEAIVNLLIPMYEMEGVSSMRIAETGQTISVQEEPVAKVLDRDKFQAWCIENDLGRSLQLPYQTTNALVKDRLLNGQPEPDGVEAYTFSKVVLRNK